MCIRDRRSATTAELLLGAGRQSKDFIYLNVGTGLAAGFVADGHILRGANQNAGEIGHMVVDLSNPYPCICGRQGLSLIHIEMCIRDSDYAWLRSDSRGIVRRILCRCLAEAAFSVIPGEDCLSAASFAAWDLLTENSILPSNC